MCASFKKGETRFGSSNDDVPSISGVSGGMPESDSNERVINNESSYSELG